MRASTTTISLAAFVLLAAAAAPAQAGCDRRIVNRTSHLVVVSQDGRPGVTVAPRRSRRIHYRSSGRIDVAVYCRAPRRGAGQPSETPAFQASYATVALLDRCFVAVDGGGAKPLALNAPRQGDIAIAPYGLACPASAPSLRGSQ